jgi:FkbM family methyltransferase
MRGSFVLDPGERTRLELPATAGEAFGVMATVRVDAGTVALQSCERDGAPVDDRRVDAGAPVGVALLAVAGGSLELVNVSTGVGACTIDEVRYEPTASPDLLPVALADPRATAGWSRYYGNRGDDLAEKARYRRYTRLDAPLTVRWSDGVRFQIAPADQLSRVLYVSGTYEPNTLRLLRAWLRPGDAFVDVGANAGVFTLVAAAWVGAGGRVLAIEPSAREFVRLTGHVALNGLSQVTTVHAAAGGVAGARLLRVAAAPRGGLNTLGDRFAYPGMPMAGLEEVEARPLDAMIAEAGLGRVQAIKLDVEGAETEALDGAQATLREHRPALVIEVCAAALAAGGSSVQALDARLRAARYACFEIDDASGGLGATPALSPATDRNVVALPIERADALLAAVPPPA